MPASRWNVSRKSFSFSDTSRGSSRWVRSRFVSAASKGSSRRTSGSRRSNSSFARPTSSAENGGREATSRRSRSPFNKRSFSRSRASRSFSARIWISRITRLSEPKNTSTKPINSECKNEIEYYTRIFKYAVKIKQKVPLGQWRMKSVRSRELTPIARTGGSTIFMSTRFTSVEAAL